MNRKPLTLSCVKIVKNALTHVLLTRIYTAFANSVDPDQLASKKPTDLDLHCLSLSIQIFINTLNQVI